ncbi:hypothetical protein BDV59DRAFT_202812 [Aspergillus ambiguus]|uniref:uncharacterized protein n=1 Tax=Aspergillus ambiguus TaxID=176160 RepID=UPI003CCD9B9B
MIKPIVSRFLGGHIHAYRISSHLYGPLHAAAVFRVGSSAKELIHAVAPNLDRAVYITPHSVVCIAQHGDLLWQYDLEPRSTQNYVGDAKCMFSLDGTFVWVYRPDAMADRGPDILVVLRADTGDEIARSELGSVGQGSIFVPHPDGHHVLLDVGEGQDGVKLYRAALTGNSIDLHSYPWNDRCLIDMAPSGQLFMTVDDARTDASFHAFPGGEEVFRLPIDAFGYGSMDEEEDEVEEACIDWNGGFLNEDIVVVTIAGERDDKEWHCHHGIDMRRRAPLGPFEAHSRDNYDFEPLGDGTWVVSGPDGNAVRHRFSEDS